MSEADTASAALRGWMESTAKALRRLEHENAQAAKLPAQGEISRRYDAVSAAFKMAADDIERALACTASLPAPHEPLYGFPGSSTKLASLPAPAAPVIVVQVPDGWRVAQWDGQRYVSIGLPYPTERQANGDCALILARVQPAPAAPTYTRAEFERDRFGETGDTFVAPAAPEEEPTVIERVVVMGHPDEPVSARCILSGCRDLPPATDTASAALLLNLREK